MTNTQRKNGLNYLMNRVGFIMELCEWLYDNRKTLADVEMGFDYPNYGGMPKNLSKKLSSMHVDMIQDNKDMWERVSFKELVDTFTGF